MKERHDARKARDLQAGQIGIFRAFISIDENGRSTLRKTGVDLTGTHRWTASPPLVDEADIRPRADQTDRVQRWCVTVGVRPASLNQPFCLADAARHERPRAQVDHADAKCSRAPRDCSHPSAQWPTRQQ